MLKNVVLSGLVTVAMTAANSASAVAAGKVIDCPNIQGELETGNFIFKPLLFGYDGNETDDGKEFEFRFVYEVTVTTYDEANPGVPGVEVCNNKSAWKQTTPIWALKYEFNTLPLDYPIVINNVPRHSKIHVNFYALEDDTFKDDKADFDPNPLGTGAVEFDVFVNSHTAHTMVGWRKGEKDLVLGSVKRLVGDGETGWSDRIEEFRAFLEFTADIVANPPRPPESLALAPNLPSIGTPLKPGPGPLTPNKEPLCRDYALKAVELTIDAEALKCGFQPPVWSHDHQMHFDWCMQGNNAATAATETQKREAALAACKSAKGAAPAPAPGQPPAGAANDMCGIYANEAVKTAAKAEALGCGFTGPRWLQDFKAHYDFCIGNPVQPLLLAEHALRNQAYQTCLAQQAGTKTKPAGTNADWVFPDSDVRALNVAEVSGLTKDGLWQARNEIYARNGLIFKSAKARAFFSAKPWYQPLYKSVNLTAVEAANVALIKSYE